MVFSVRKKTGLWQSEHVATKTVLVGVGDFAMRINIRNETGREVGTRG
jgi:hypothetical protein